MIQSSLSVQSAPIHNPSPQEPPASGRIFALFQEKISKNEAEKQQLEKRKSLLEAEIPRHLEKKVSLFEV